MRPDEIAVADLKNKDFGYDYPKGPTGRRLDLRYGSDLTTKICKEVRNRVLASRQLTNQFESRHLEMDRILDAFMPESEWDAKVKKKDPRRPTTIVIPMSFAMLQVFRTYMTREFMNGMAIQRYRAYGRPKAILNAAKAERLCFRQSLWFKEPITLNTLWGDAYTYGRGVAALKWTSKTSDVSVAREVDTLLAMIGNIKGLGLNKGDIIRHLERRVQYQGTEIVPMNNYNTFVDPKAPGYDIQQASFIGWADRESSLNILRKERDPDEQLFNGKLVRILSKAGQGLGDEFYQAKGAGTFGGTKDIDVHHEASDDFDFVPMVMDIIPSELGIGDSDYPETWLATIGCGGTVVTQFHRLEYEHGQKPFISYTPNLRGNAPLPISPLMTTYGFQIAGDWLLKSRIDAVNTILNGIIFFDPTKVDEEDMMDPGQGKLVRVKLSAYGEGGIERYVHQMQTVDPTAGHMQNIAELDQMGRTFLGVGDMAMGNMNNLPDRPTKAGINAATSGIFSRLDWLAQLADTQCMQSLAWQKIHNCRQFMDDKVYVPVIGNYEQQLRQELGIPPDETGMMVTPLDLDAYFEVVPYSSRIAPDDTAAISEVLKTFLAVDGVAAQIASEYRVSDMFATGMRKLGFDDIHEYRTTANGPVDVRILPDEEVLQGVEAGNYV